MTDFSWDLPFSSRRSPLISKQMVATSHPLAAQAGLDMLKHGGNAVDAAVATAATLTVVEPTMNGIGSDSFAIVSAEGKLYGLNASGKSPASWSPELFAQHTEMPKYGWNSVTVPGAVSGWVELSKRLGKLPFASLMAPAIKYAREGFHVTPVIAKQWRDQSQLLSSQPGFAKCFLVNGDPPKAGQLYCNEDQATTLEKIAITNGNSFYRGELAEKMVVHSSLNGGKLTKEDLASHSPEWVTPMEIKYRNYSLHELPPNGQGIAALIAVGILDYFDLSSMGPKNPNCIHLQIEAMKLAFKDTYRHVADLNSMKVDHEQILDQAYLKGLCNSIKMEKASELSFEALSSSDTVYLSSADNTGMMVSFIQSNYSGFGSGVVVDGTGISLQNRGAGFSLIPGHPNLVAGGKRPFHTIIPGFVSKSGLPYMSFGVMGADMQPQGHLQMLVNTLDFNYNVQASADAPRWKITKKGEIFIEEGMPSSLMDGLAKKGHKLNLRPYGSFEFGATQMIKTVENGFIGATEPRRDGAVVGY